MRNTIHVITAAGIIISCFFIGQHYYQLTKEKDEKISFYKNELTRMKVNFKYKKDEADFLKKEVLAELEEIKKNVK